MMGRVGKSKSKRLEIVGEAMVGPELPAGGERGRQRDGVWGLRTDHFRPSGLTTHCYTGFAPLKSRDDAHL